MFAETRPEAIEEMRAAADELRAELAGETVTFVVNRNINISNVCTVGCAFCGFGQGKRSPDAYEHDEARLRRPHPRRDRLRRHRAVHPVGHPPRLAAGGLPGLAARWPSAPPRARARSCTCTRTARWRSRTCATSPGWPPSEVFARSAGRRSRLDAGHRRRGAARRRARAHLARTSCRSRAGWRSSKPHTQRGCARPPPSCSATSRSRGSWPSTCAWCASCRNARGGITEFVPLSFIPFQTLLGRTHGVEEISREENLKHTAVVSPRARAHDREPAGVLGEDGS